MSDENLADLFDFDVVEMSATLEKFEGDRLIETIYIENGEIVKIVKEEE